MKIINKLYLQIIKKPKNKWLIILYLWLFGLPLLAKRLRYKFTKELLPNKIRGKRILDVGCTIGDFALILAEKGANVVGVDLKNRMRQAQKIAKIHQLKAKFIASDVNKLEYHYYFDGIIALDIIEHIQNDSKFIKKLNSMLRQSGFLILSVPSIYREIVEKREKEIGHVRTGYSKSQMTKLLTPLGFKINDLLKNPKG